MQHLCLLGRGQLLRRNNRDFLFLVELLVEFLVLASNVLNKDQALVLSQHRQEVVRNIMELGGLRQGFVQQGDLFDTDT